MVDFVENFNNSNYNYGTKPSIPVAEQNQTYFAYFNGIGGTRPEYIDGTGYFIKYLIDINGNVVNPEPYTETDSVESVPLHNLKANFEVGKRATIKLIEPDPLQSAAPNVNSLKGTHTIAHVGKIVPILVTETGENRSDYVATMSFGATSTLTTQYIPNLNFKLQYKGPPDEVDIGEEFSGAAYQANTSRSLDYNITLTDNPSWDWDATNYELTAFSSSADTHTKIRFKLSTYIEIQPVDWQGDNDLYTENSFRFGISKNGGNIEWSNWGWMWNKAEGAESQRSGYKEYVSPWIDDYVVGDTFKFYAGASSYARVSSAGSQRKYLVYRGADDTAGTTLTVEQDTPAGEPTTIPIFVDGVNILYAPYFYRILNFVEPTAPPNSLSNYSILLLTPPASAVYNYGSVQNIDPASSTFGFSPITIPFGDLKPGDFIRFEYKKEQTFLITRIYEDYVYDSESYTAIQVTPNIDSNLSIDPEEDTSLIEFNHFQIYRVLNDGLYVTLDVTPDWGPGGNAYTGLLVPEFISQELSEKLETLIKDLTQNEIIQ